MDSYVLRSSEVLGSFARSDSKDALIRILKGDGEALKIAQSTRRIYRIGPFEHKGEQRYAAVKVSPDPKRIPALFELLFIAECSRREEIGVPSFVFAARHNGAYAVVMEDLTAGETCQLNELTSANDLPFAKQKEFVQAKFYHLHGLELTAVSLHVQAHDQGPCPWTLLSLARDYVQTSFVVHDGQRYKRIVCADADQLEPSFPCLLPSTFSRMEYHLLLDV